MRPPWCVRNSDPLSAGSVKWVCPFPACKRQPKTAPNLSQEGARTWQGGIRDLPQGGPSPRNNHRKKQEQTRIWQGGIPSETKVATPTGDHINFAVARLLLVTRSVYCKWQYADNYQAAQRASPQTINYFHRLALRTQTCNISHEQYNF